MDRAAVSQPAVQGVDLDGDVIEGTRCLRMLDRPSLVGLTLRAQTGQSASRVSFLCVCAGALGGAEVFHGTSGGSISSRRARTPTFGRIPRTCRAAQIDLALGAPAAPPRPESEAAQ